MHVPIATLVAHDEGGHGFISGSGLELVVGAVLLATLAALHPVSLGALNTSQLEKNMCQRLLKTKNSSSWLFAISIEL